MVGHHRTILLTVIGLHRKQGDEDNNLFTQFFSGGKVDKF